MVSLLALALAAAAPSPEAQTLGRQIAEHGTLASLLPLLQQKEAEELIAAHPELSADEQAKLRSTAIRVYETSRERLMAAEGRSWAGQLTVAEMRAILTYQNSTAGKRYRAVTPAVIAATLKSIGQLDFKSDVLAAFCKETGKLCSK
jgi:hypothetical protein